MKITRRPPSGLPDVGTAPPVGEVAEPAAGTPGQRGDRVELSSEARLRARLRQEIGDLDAVPSEQVQALRAEIESGTYYRDSQAVAERFLRDVAADLLA